jgi:uncharacterized protein
MRISKQYIESIKSVIRRFDSMADIYLFGSRTDDTKKGGDIDILVISEKITFLDKIKINVNLYSLIGEQRIDLLVKNNFNNPFLNFIKDECIKL